MKFSKTVLDSIAYELPPEVWTSESIEEKLSPLYDRLKLPYGRLELMTGIKERRFWPESVQPSEVAAIAGKKALDKAAIAIDDIDLLIYAGVCRDRIEPATAAYVHKLLKLNSNVQVLDVSNACLGFLNAIVLAAGMIESSFAKAALIVSGEDGRPLLENTIKHLLTTHLNRNAIKPFFANLTIGSAAVGAVIASSDICTKGRRFLGGVVSTDSAASSLCEGAKGYGNSLEMHTDSEALLTAGISIAKQTWRKFEKNLGFSPDVIDCTICHQVGQRHQTELYKAIGLNPKNDFSSFQFLGNVGSASVPITLAMALEQGKIQVGNTVGLLGIGSGLSSIILAMEG